MKTRAALLALAAAALFVPIPPRVVERFYSHGLFPVIQPLLTALSNRAPFALFDVLLTGVVVAARPKTTLLNWYFKRAAVDGMTDPYFLETLVPSQLLPFERPFVLAHEWSHLAGLADEGDANFLGWLACVQAAPPQQYSGWLFLYTEVSATFRARDRADLARRLGPGPRADLTAIADRLAREVSPRVSAAGWRVYDQYLKANRVPAGAASYAQVVRLVLGTHVWSSAAGRQSSADTR